MMCSTRQRERQTQAVVDPRLPSCTSTTRSTRVRSMRRRRRVRGHRLVWHTDPVTTGRRTPRRPGGQLFVWPGRMLYLGRGGDASAHAHHALQLVLAIEGSFELRIGASHAWVERTSVLIGSDVVHEYRQRGPQRIALVYVDPDGAEGRRLRAITPSGGTLDVADEVARSLRRDVEATGRGGWDRAHAERWCTAVLSTLVGATVVPAPQHPAVRRALSFLATRVDERTTLADLAAAAGVSPGRLVHVFGAQVGLPIRRYCLWLRVQRAAQLALAGTPLTEAAHAAGFADSAHMTRTFRRMFGLTPSSVVDLGELISG